jgi:hypothetical protein
MSNIQFSLIAPSIRPNLWKQFYNSIKNTKIVYEVIFVGPISPKEKLPENFRWITTNVKPSQCTHIGFLEAKGEIVSLTADDAVYFSPNGKSALDNMYEFMENFSTIHNKKKIAYGFRMFEDQFCGESSRNHYLVSPSSSDTTPILLFPFFAIYRELYEEMEGYDNRFICGQAENDFLLRVAAKNGGTESALCPIAMVWAKHDDHNNSSKFREYHAQEYTLVKKLWTKNGKFEIVRQDIPVHKYINDDSIYNLTQGEKGEWI